MALAACGGSSGESEASRLAAKSGPQQAISYEEPVGFLLAGATGMLVADRASGCLWLKPDPHEVNRHPNIPPFVLELHVQGRVRIDWTSQPVRLLDRKGRVLARVGSVFHADGGLVGDGGRPGCPVPPNTDVVLAQVASS